MKTVLIVLGALYVLSKLGGGSVSQGIATLETDLLTPGGTGSIEGPFPVSEAASGGGIGGTGSGSTSTSRFFATPQNRYRLPSGGPQN